MKINDLHKHSLSLEDTETMPALFIGHGTPMNAIEDNEFSQKWKLIGQELPRPQAILCISAHWETKGTYITAVDKPATIHDFYGFPNELFQQNYAADGSPELAEIIHHSTKNAQIGLDYKWGLDHGSWSILKHLYPKADIPVLQLSIDYTQDTLYHYELAKELAFLRQKGVLIIGSGNMIHNLRMLQVEYGDINAPYGYDWAIELNSLLKDKINAADHQALIRYQCLSQWTQLAMPSLEHYVPLIYILALQKPNEQALIFNDEIVAGSLSMTSVLINS